LQEVGNYLGFGRAFNSWTQDELDRADAIVQSGYSQFLYDAFTESPMDPESDSGEKGKDARRRKPHDWSFLQQSGEIVTNWGNKLYMLPEGFAGNQSDLIIESGEGRVSIVSERHLTNLLAVATKGVIPTTPIVQATYDPTDDVFYPENYGAAGDGTTNDTAAFESMIAAAIDRGNITGSVTIKMRRKYLLDEIDRISHYSAVGNFAKVECDLWFDAEGANFIHSGTGKGIFLFEGYSLSERRFIWQGGHATGANTTDSRWFIAGRDIRGSYIHPMEVDVFEYGVLLMIWRTWAENNSVGSSSIPMFGRSCEHIVGCFGREESWAYILNQQGQNLPIDQYQGELSSDPGSPSDLDWYWSTTDDAIRQYQTSAWVEVLPIADVDGGVSGNSFARTTIGRITIGTSATSTNDGSIVEIQGASLYDSRIHDLRGNTRNDDNSLVYINDSFCLNLTIEDIGVEGANQSGNPIGYAIRTGPNYETATRPPNCRFISYTGGYGQPSDPDAGVIVNGEWDQVDFAAGVDSIVVPVGIVTINTTLEVTLKSADASVLSRALIGFRNASVASASIEVGENKGSLVTWSQDGSNNIVAQTASAKTGVRITHRVIKG